MHPSGALTRAHLARSSYCLLYLEGSKLRLSLLATSRLRGQPCVPQLQVSLLRTPDLMLESWDSDWITGLTSKWPYHVYTVALPTTIMHAVQCSL